MQSGAAPVTGNSSLLGRNSPAVPGQCHALGSSSSWGHWERKAGITLRLPTKIPLSKFCDSWERSNITTQPEPAEHCLAAGNPLEIPDQTEIWSYHPQKTSCYKFLGLQLFINVPIRLEFKNALRFVTTEPSHPLGHLPHAREFRKGICYMRMVKICPQDNLLQQCAEERSTPRSSYWDNTCDRAGLLKHMKLTLSRSCTPGGSTAGSEVNICSVET